MTARRVVIILFLLQTSIFCLMTFRPYFLAPPGHTYSQFSKNYFFPIFFYPNMILQAKDGAWAILDTHTTEPQKPVYSQWFFVFAGKFAALFHTSATVTFILSQVSGALLLFAVTYLFITRLLPKSYHTLAIVLALAIELGPSPQSLLQHTNIVSWTPAINDYILLFRHFDIPHHLWAEALGIASLLLVIASYQKRTAVRITGIFLTTLLSALFIPSIVATLWVTVYPVFFLWALATRTLKRIILPLSAAFLATVIAGVQTRFALTMAGIPWSLYSINEKTWVGDADALWQYLSSLLLFLPFLILFLAVLPFVWKRWQASMRLTLLLLFAWVISPFVGIPLSKLPFFPIPNFRLVIGPLYIATGILSAVGMIEAVKCIHSANMQKIIFTIVTGFLIGISLCLTGIYLTSFFTYQNKEDPHAYPEISTWKAVQFLQTVPRGSGIMVREQYGEVIPGVADLRVYIGGQHHFPDWTERQSAALSFFSGTMTQDEAKQFLLTNDIRYVFWGPDEQAVTTQKPLYPDILTSVFQNATATIYEIR